MTKIPEKMKFATLVKDHEAEVRTRDLPEIGEHDVLLKMQACNICTTDYQQWLGLREHQGYPMAGGHESTGVVVAKGSKVNDFEIGDHVACGYPGCGHCESCLEGDYASCSSGKMDTYDGYKWGFFGFSDYIVKSVVGLYKVSKTLDPSCAGFLEPIATVIHGMNKLHVKPFETVVVIGAGTMGLINAQVARSYGARVIVSELMEKKLKTAKKMGFEVIDGNNENPVKRVMELTENKGADAVIPAVGASVAYQQGLDMLKQNDGRFLVFAAGYPAPELKIDANEIHYRKIEIIGTYAAMNDDFKQAAKALSTGIVDVSYLVEDKKFKLEDIQSAYEYASQPGMYRVSVLLDE